MTPAPTLVLTTSLFGALLLLVWSFGAGAIGNSLVCAEDARKSRALLLENFDPDYLVFERATRLHRMGVASRILVPVPSGRPEGEPSPVAQGIAEVMARVARTPSMELIPIREREPITLNAARQVLEFLLRERISSVTVVAPAFRSARSQLVYSSVFSPAGVSVRCVPVFGTRSTSSWTDTWHGIQDVGLQFVKLQYYRFWVLI